MIIIVATDDPQLQNIANESRAQSPVIYGTVYQGFKDKIPQVGLIENLFFLAHGAYDGDEGTPVIGDEREDHYFTATDLYNNIREILPVGYAGDVFVDACESATFGTTVSFIELFKTVLEDHGINSRVFGKIGTTNGLIPLPGDPSWIDASNPS